LTENAGHEFDGHEIAGRENDGHEIGEQYIISFENKLHYDAMWNFF